MTGAAVLAPAYDPERAIRATLPLQEPHLSRVLSSARALHRFAGLDEDQLEAALAPRLAALRCALARSPFYRDTLRRAGLGPGDLRDIPDLRHFPLLDRCALADRQDDLANLDVADPEARHLLFDRTAGSTGRPLRVLKDTYDTLHPWAVLRFWMRWLGVSWPRRPRAALVCGLPHGVEYAIEPPVLGGGQLRRISLARPDPLRRLLEFRPHVIFTDPAGLHWLAGRGELPAPRLLLTSAQHLARPLRDRVGARLSCPLVNYYSTTETGPLAWECPGASGRWHVLHPDVWVESLEGELVVTRLRQSVLPLLRYRTGDAGGVMPERCVCGYRGRSIVGFEGRRACRFETPRGNQVDAWQLAWLFKHHALDVFRLTQVAPSSFRLELTGSCDVPALVERLRAALRSLGWDRPTLELRRGVQLVTEGAKPEPFRTLVKIQD